MLLVLPQEARSQQLFWASGSGGDEPDRIQTSMFDGSGVSTIYDGLNNPIGLAVDPANNHIYISENATDGRVLRGSLDGSAPLETLVTGAADFAQELRFDSGSNQLFWATFADGIFRADTDGSNVQNIVPQPNNERYTSLEVDGAGEQLFFSNPSTGTGWVSDFDGTITSEVEDYFSDNWVTNSLLFDDGDLYFPEGNEVILSDLQRTSDTVLDDASALALGMALSPDGNTLFWSDRVDVDGDRSGSFIRALDLTDPNADSIELVSGVTDPWGIAAIPEPSTYVLIFALGAGALVLVRRRFAKK